uniref:Uncharacterized protein n=1 Tax=Cucumis melo TaxID=3656 RepID=A0A9I9EBQ5_CUCME
MIDLKVYGSDMELRLRPFVRHGDSDNSLSGTYLSLLRLFADVRSHGSSVPPSLSEKRRI